MEYELDVEYVMMNDTQVILHPRQLIVFQQFNQSEKSKILLGNVLKLQKCNGRNVIDIPR